MSDPLYPEHDPDLRHEAEQARDEALDHVTRGANPAWTAQARAAIMYVAQRREFFTSDPIWTVLGAWAVPPPREPRALGPVIRTAMSDGILAKANRTHKSVRPPCHRRDLPVYVSLIYPDHAKAAG